jgi:hypothetical protein
MRPNKYCHMASVPTRNVYVDNIAYILLLKLISYYHVRIAAWSNTLFSLAARRNRPKCSFPKGAPNLYIM